jgi:glycosyltransferase involved in cell wall biosynthesis
VAHRVSVIVCAFTERRWEQTRAALASVLGQQPGPAQVVLVIDHNPALAARARRELAGVTVLESDGPPGLSGARNCGLRAATEPITAFLDDDAEASPGWLAALIEPYDRGDVVATGGSVHPRWPADRPGWMPPTFDWVVGCSYLGLPDSVAQVRNPIGANMSMRTDMALRAGGFDTAVGRVKGRPSGCEETELSIRLAASQPGGTVLYVPAAAVDHCVSPDRVTVRYFLRRCWHEGRSKAEVVRLAGATAGLERERRHVAAVIPAAMLRDLRAATGGDRWAIGRVAASSAGFAMAAAGYLAQRAATAAGLTQNRPADRPPVSVP